MIPSSGQNGLSRFESFSTREPRRISDGIGTRSATTLAGRLVVAQAEVDGRAQPAVARPLGELDLGDERRLDPGHVARRTCGSVGASANGGSLAAQRPQERSRAGRARGR